MFANHLSKKMTKLLAFCLLAGAVAFAPSRVPVTRSVAVSGLGEWIMDGLETTTKKKGADDSWKDEALKEQLKILAMRKAKAKKSSQPARAAKPAPRRTTKVESFAQKDHTPAGHIDLIGALGNLMGAEDNRDGPRP